MNEVLPYEHQLNQQWMDLPLPDENRAWADMSRRLDEDDDDRFILWWQKGCLGWVVLLIAVIAAGWFIFHPEKWFRSKSNVPPVSIVTPRQETKQVQPGNKSLPPIQGKNEEETSKSKDTTINSPLTEKKTDKNITPHGLSEKEKGQKNNDPSQKPVIHWSKKGISHTSSKRKSDQQLKKPGIGHSIDSTGSRIVTDKPQIVSTDEKKSVPDEPKNSKGIKTSQDSIRNVSADTVKNKVASDQEPKEKNTKTDTTKKNKFLFSAGIGEQQQLPIAGQKLTPYNAQGRKGTLADYIPSVYLRIERKNKWFIQAAFRYGAPQYTKQFLYRQTVVPDTGTNPVFSTVTNATLKKTYYHQLPLTFDYLIGKRWSAGAGIQWNKFSSAISEQDQSRRNNFSQVDSLVSKKIFREKADTSSVFRKSYFQALFQLQFKWNRLSAGASYSFGLQPYIQFSLPGSPVQKERNNSIQLFIRYELWRSGKK